MSTFATQLKGEISRIANKEVAEKLGSLELSQLPFAFRLLGTNSSTLLEFKVSQEVLS